MTTDVQGLVARFHEINPVNYNHDEVCALNAWGCEAVDLIERQAAELEVLNEGRAISNMLVAAIEEARKPQTASSFGDWLAIMDALARQYPAALRESQGET